MKTIMSNLILPINELFKVQCVLRIVCYDDHRIINKKSRTSTIDIVVLRPSSRIKKMQYIFYLTQDEICTNKPPLHPDMDHFFYIPYTTSEKHNSVAE